MTLKDILEITTESYLISVTENEVTTKTNVRVLREIVNAKIIDGDLKVISLYLTKDNGINNLPVINIDLDKGVN